MLTNPEIPVYGGTWSSSDAGVATVFLSNATTGVVTPVAAGTAIISFTATAHGVAHPAL